MADEVSGVLRGRYRLRSLLGQGGMAAVYRATDEFLGRDVAVKVFRSSASAAADFKAQQDEVNMIARLSHPSLVTLLDAAVDHSDPQHPRIFFVMELIEGADLNCQLTHGPLPARQVALIGRDIAEGLEYMHRRGVVHRDVKPANILLGNYADDGSRMRAKLTDFGIALTGDTAEQPDDSIVVTGTVAYLSPEQVKGEAITAASDVYSLGLVLLECFTAELAYPGPAEESAMARLDGDPRIPDALSSEWRTLLRAMTEWDPSARPTTTELVLALNQLVNIETGRHKQAGAAEPEDGDGAEAGRETARIEALNRYDLLDTPADGAFDRITALAARVVGAPIAIVSIVDHDNIWFKARHGTDVERIDRAPGLCASAILHDEPWVVRDAQLDPRSLANPLVAGEFGLRFYVGVPLRTHDGHNLGTLCVLDFQPRDVTEEQLASLKDLAAMVMHELDLRLEARRTLGVPGAAPVVIPEAPVETAVAAGGASAVGAEALDVA